MIAEMNNFITKIRLFKVQTTNESFLKKMKKIWNLHLIQKMMRNWILKKSSHLMKRKIIS